MHVDLTDLRLFLHVAESGSITHGAARAHMALASASARVRAMEEDIGAALLVRGRRGVTPTPAGEALLHHARVMLEQMERLRGELGEYARGLKGHVRLVCNTSALSEFLPEALGTWLAANPDVDVDIEERLSHEIVQRVTAGLADVGIVADTVGHGSLETFPFRMDRLVLAVPEGDPLATRREVAFADVLDRELVGLGIGAALQDHVAEHAVRAGRPLKVRVRLRSFEGVCRMVEAGVGIAVVPQTAVRRCRRTMAIRAVRLSDPWTLRRLGICVRSIDALPAHARRMVEHLRADAPAEA